MTRIVVDPEELDRFAALALEAAEDYAGRAIALRSFEMIPMPPEVGAAVFDALARVSANVQALSTSLYAEAAVLRARAAVLDPVLRRFLVPAPAGRPG